MNSLCVFVLSCFNRVQLFATPLTIARQAPLVHGILRARILEWVAIPCSSIRSRPRDRTRVSCGSCTAGGSSFRHIWPLRMNEKQRVSFYPRLRDSAFVRFVFAFYTRSTSEHHASFLPSFVYHLQFANILAC